MNCDTCANMNNNRCRTMMKPPKELFCHMTKAQVVKSENDIINYAITNAADESSMYRIIREAKSVIKGLDR